MKVNSNLSRHLAFLVLLLLLGKTDTTAHIWRAQDNSVVLTLSLRLPVGSRDQTHSSHSWHFPHGAISRLHLTFLLIESGAPL